MNRRSKVRIAVTLFAAAVLCAQTARAEVIIPSVNLDDLVSSGEIGVLILGPSTSDFLTPPTGGVMDIGDLVNEVFLNEQGAVPIYTYMHTVTPDVSNISEFNTGFDLRSRGFNGVAGYSFSDSDVVSGLGTEDDFLIVFDNDTDGTLDWEANLPLDEFFDAGESIRFFFQSTMAPSTVLGNYNIINSEVGTAQSFLPSTPVPAPAALSAGVAGLLMLMSKRPQRRRSAAATTPAL